MSDKKDKKKGLFGKALDSLSDREEKEALENAERELSEAEKLAEKAQLKASRTEAALKEAEEKIKELEAEMEKAESEKRREELMERIRKASAERKAALKPKYIAEHEVAKDETLSHIALKHYGHATKPYYMLIYEANKEVIGDNPDVIRRGMVLNIPELPEDLKK